MKHSLPKTINLTLSGGGARGVFHLGVLQYLDDAKIEINSISGSSIGAVVGASYLSGVSPKEQLQLFKSKALRKIFKFNYFRQSLLQIDTKHKILAQLIPKENFQDLRRKLYITTFDITNSQKICLESGNLLKAITATISLPLLFPPVAIDFNYCIDGGIVDNIPTYPFETEHFCVASNLHPPLEKKFKQGLFQSLKRSVLQAWLFSSTKGLSQADLEITSQKLHNYSIFTIKDPDALFELGYQCASDFFETNPHEETIFEKNSLVG